MDCKLRDWQIEDAEQLSNILNNKNILDNLRDGIPYPYTIHDAKIFINDILGNTSQDVYSFAILSKNQLVGNITLYRQNNIHSRTAEIGYYIGEGFWGKGIGSTAIQLACDYIFEYTDIIRIFATPFSHNSASCKLLEKSNFKHEGTLRQNAIKNGEIYDMEMYARLRPI